MLQVHDVAASSRWYQSTLNLRSGHGGDEFEMLFDGDEFVLQLHRLDAHEHGILQSGIDGTPMPEGPHWNPLAHHHEATLLDPDGYIVVINTPFASEP